MLRLALLVALVLPGAAFGAGPTLVARDLPLGAVRTLSAVSAPVRFNMVGLHWQGSGDVRFRTRSLRGVWSAWQAAGPEPEDQPDRSSGERRRTAAWRLGSPYFVPASDRIEYRTSGAVRRLRA